MAQGETYEEFVEKFKPKRTTDDCYTPENIYDAVAGWVEKEYGLNRSDFVRPFWPGGDYEHYDYPVDCVVVDNPPFSILKKILQFYEAHGVKFFLFCQTQTLCNAFFGTRETCGIACGLTLEFENGAVINTSFVTNLDPEHILRTAPDLYTALDAVNRANQREKHAQLPRYAYPDHVISGAYAARYCRYGVRYAVKRRDAVAIRKLDSQTAVGKTVFGGGLLLSEGAAKEKAAAEKVTAERAAAEKAAAEKAAAEKAGAIIWELSGREKEIVKQLGD